MARHGHVFDYYSGECENKTIGDHFTMRALVTDGEPGALDDVMEASVPDSCGFCSTNVVFNSDTIFWPPTVELTVEDVTETFNKTNGYICLEINIQDSHAYRNTDEEQITLQNGENTPLPLGDDGNYYVTCVDDVYYFVNSNGDNPLEETDQEMDDEFMNTLLNRYEITPVSLDETPLKYETNIPTDFMGSEV